MPPLHQHVRIVLEVMADLRPLHVLEERLDLRERLPDVELLWRAGVVVGERQVRGLAGSMQKDMPTTQACM
jgi:hypothetical protein